MTRLLQLVLAIGFLSLIEPTCAVAAISNPTHLRVLAPASQPTQAQIDAAASEAQSQGRVVNITPGGMTIPAALQEVASLPVTFRSTIGNWNYDITVLSMSFTPTGSVLSMGCRFYLPGSTTNTSLYFGANDIAVSGKSGFSGDLPILESLLNDAKSSELDDPVGKLGGQTKFVEFPVPAFQGKAWMGLGKDTKLSFSCGEFKKFSLSGFLKVYDLVEREDPAGQTLADGKPLLFFWGTKDVFDWQDMYFPVTASRGFHSANADDIGFHPTDKTNAILDLSNYQSPANLPDCGGGSLGDSWQGIQFDAFAIRLPKLFKLRNPHTLMGQGTNLFLSPNGVIGTVIADKVFALEEGYTDEINKFDLSLDQVTANFSCGASASISMSGRFRLGTCGTGAEKAKELYYNVVYTEQDRRYQVLIKESATDRFKNNGLTLSTGSTLNLSIQNESFVFQTALPAKPRLSTPAYNNSICLNYPTTLTASNCESINSKWSTGETDKGTVAINPKATTTYKINCFDKYCINEDSDNLTITVYESLPQPTLTTSSLAFCTYQNASLRADQCVGKLEWQTPDNTTFRELSSNPQTAYFPNQAATTSFVYTVRCNLNTCLSPEKPLSLTVYPEPKAPSLWSSATNNTIDRNNDVTISGSCSDNNSIVWDNLPQATVKLTSSATYSAYCKNPGTGCQTQSHSSIGINVLYFPPAGPSPVTFGSVGTNYITVNWRDNSDNEDGFWIDRDTSPAFNNSVRVGDVGANVTSFIDYNLTEGATYYYRIVSHNRYDYGYSEVASRATGVTPDKPILTASSTNIERGSNSNVSGYCRIGTLIWVTPSTFSGGSYRQTDAITYTAKCSSGGIESGESYLTVTVFDKPIPCSTPAAPKISVADVTIEANQSSGELKVEGCAGTIRWETNGSQNASITVNPGYYTVTCTVYSDKCSNSSTTGGTLSKKDAPCSKPDAPKISVADVTIEANQSSGELKVEGCAGTIRWETNGSQNASITVNPGYYTVTCTVYSGDCSNSSTVGGTLSKKDAPCSKPDAPKISVADVTIEANQSSGELKVEGCAGTIRWETNGSQNASITVNPGYYTVTCTVYSDKCSNSSTTGGTLSKKDAPCSKPDAPVVYLNGQANGVIITKGEHVQVTASCPGGSSVVWTNPEGNDGSSDKAPTGNTYYAAKCKTNTGGCLSEASGHVVTVNEKPVECSPPSQPTLSASSTSIDKGASVTLTASTCPGGSSLDWENEDNSQVERTLTPDQTTTYRVRCWQSNTCYSEWAEITVTVNVPCTNPPTPIIRLISGGTLVEEGTEVTLTASPCPNSTSWYKNGNLIQSSGSTLKISTGSGTYTAKCINGTCSSDKSTDIYLTFIPKPVIVPTTPLISPSKTTICTNQRESSVLTVDNCNGSLSWSTGETANSITVYEAKTYTAYCATIGQSAMSKDQKIENAAPSVSITRSDNYFNASSRGCTTEISWYREANGSRAYLKTGSSIDTKQYGGGRYEARCSNNCGDGYAVDYAQQ